MRLSSSDFVDVYDALVAAALRDGAAAEHRLGPRVLVDGEVLVILVRGGVVTESFTALARDVSYGGMGLLQRKRPPAGAQLIVQLPRRDEAPAPVLCDVVYARQLADDVFAVGVTFKRSTTLDQSATDAAEIARLRRAVIE